MCHNFVVRWSKRWCGALLGSGASPERVFLGETGASSLERIGRGREPMDLRANMGS
jgi:hypothetical protein